VVAHDGPGGEGAASEHHERDRRGSDRAGRPSDDLRRGKVNAHLSSCAWRLIAPAEEV
jgi:hypothetical protein